MFFPMGFPTAVTLSPRGELRGCRERLRARPAMVARAAVAAAAPDLGSDHPAIGGSAARVKGGDVGDPGYTKLMYVNMMLI